jgi:plasmid maintenance system antidote protein VapI
MALRHSKTLDRSAESWLTMQGNYNLWQTRQVANIDGAEILTLPAQKSATGQKRVYKIDMQN